MAVFESKPSFTESTRESTTRESASRPTFRSPGDVDAPAERSENPFSKSEIGQNTPPTDGCWRVSVLFDSGTKPGIEMDTVERGISRFLAVETGHMPFE